MKRYPVGNRIFIPRMVIYNNTNRKAEERNEEDKNLPFRKSHESPIIKQVYQEYLEEPGSHIAHQILHTTFVKRNKTVQL